MQLAVGGESRGENKTEDAVSSVHQSVLAQT